MDAHEHSFDAWPFEDAVNTAAFATRHVVEGSRPILEVYHDEDGDWQFVCGTTAAAEDGRLVCLGCMLEHEPALAQLADLPRGWMARRDHSQAPWRREPDEADPPPA